MTMGKDFSIKTPGYTWVCHAVSAFTSCLPRNGLSEKQRSFAAGRLSVVGIAQKARRVRFQELSTS